MSHPNSDELNSLFQMLNLGRLPQAATIARQMTLRYPSSGVAWRIFGGILGRMGRAGEAFASLQKAVALAPDDIDAYCGLGVAQQQLGRLQDAETSLRQALVIDPNHSLAHFNLGCVLKDLGRAEEAEACFRSAVQIQPDFGWAYANLARTLRNLDRLQEAEANFRSALNFMPNDADVHNDLGVALRDLGRLDQAETSFRRAVHLRPKHELAHCNLGNVLKEFGRYEEAQSCYRQALHVAPGRAESYNGLGVVLHYAGQFEEAETVFRQALQIDADFFEAHCNLASVLKDLGRFADAEASYRRALQLKPDDVRVQSHFLFFLNYTGHDAGYRMEAARRFGRTVAAKARRAYSTWTCTLQPNRLRVGLVSGDLRRHSVAYFLQGLLANMDPARVELFAYPTCHRADDLTDWMRPRFAAWQPLVGEDDEAAARRIHADGVHILIDLSGHTAYNRLALFAWKPAPIQVSWLGYFATTGVAQIDYLIADRTTLPPAEEAFFTEKIWRLPHTRLCFSAPSDDVPVSQLPALLNGHVTFGCFSTLSKINEAVVALWARILTAVPASRLFLKARQLGEPGARQGLMEAFADHGIPGDRLLLEGPAPRAQYLAAYQKVDIGLDPFPFSGGTTSVESLWMGVPVLTLAGERFVARQGVGLMTNAGLPDWIADDAVDYVRRAARHACDLPALASLRGRLRAQVVQSPIFDGPRFARDFEAALQAMWDAWRVEHAEG